MKLLKTRISAFVIALTIALSVFAGFGAFFGSALIVNASSESTTSKYFYSTIEQNILAKKFYNLLENLYNSGAFKKGTLQYDLGSNGILSQNEISAYVNGTDNNVLTKSYAMARDCFYMDHPDLFYIDIFSLSISAGKQGNKYVAFLDSSRVLTLYRGNLNTEDSVNSAISNYESKLNEIVTEANKLSTTKEKIEYVNKYISDHNTYGYGTVVVDNRNTETDKAGYIYTSYGALVNNESVCEGYAKSFKAVLDRLNIPCVCVQGYSKSSVSPNYEPHMWNYVAIDDLWYVVDVTYNATSGRNDWLLEGGQKIIDSHIEDGSVSTSGYELKYPAIRPYEFGNNLAENGLTIIDYYTTYEEAKYLEFLVSYNGKSALKLYEEEGKHIAFKMGVAEDNSSKSSNTETTQSNSANIKWGNWYSVYAFNEAIKKNPNWEGEIFPSTDSNTTLKSTVIAMAEYFKFTIINAEPDSKGEYGEGAYNITGEEKVSYDESKLVVGNEFTGNVNCLISSSEFRNNAYGQDYSAPMAIGFYPANTATLPVDKTYDIKVVFSDELEYKYGYGDNAEPITLEIQSSMGNDTIAESTKIENFTWDGYKTITFTFTPSKMYIHNSATCYFTVKGLVGKNNKKDADPFSYTFGGKNVVCSKVFNDGRLYMNVFGAPSLLDTSDLSLNEFKDDKGNYVANSQRSQLLLVASKATDSEKDTLENRLKQDKNIQDSDIVASSTYEINLQICGMVHRVPNGSYMQVAFGFPEGYSKDDAGTTFKIYHYKKEGNTIVGVEEIPVIITEYGLIARVNSFSPFTIVQIKKSSSAVTNSNVKNIYASVNGNVGGTIRANGKSGIAEVSGENITYNITADTGYTIGCVRLNGKMISPSMYSNGNLTLNKSDLEESNTLEVVFVTEQSANRYSEQGVNLSFGTKGTFTPSPVTPLDSSNNPNANGAVIAIIVGLIVLIGGACVVWFVYGKNKLKQ